MLYPQRRGGSSSPDATGDGPCSISGAAVNGICADTMGDSLEPSHAFEGSYNGALSNSSCSIPSAVGKDICSNAAGLALQAKASAPMP